MTNIRHLQLLWSQVGLRNANPWVRRSIFSFGLCRTLRSFDGWASFLQNKFCPTTHGRTRFRLLCSTIPVITKRKRKLRTRKTMNMKATNTMPINSGVESSGRISIEPHSPLLGEPRQSSKRKAPHDCSKPGACTPTSSKSDAQMIDKVLERKRTPWDKQFENSRQGNERVEFRRLEYEHDEAMCPPATRFSSSLKVSQASTATVDDLSVLQGLPKKRQRYQRRNSFLIPRDSSRTCLLSTTGTSFHPKIMQDINKACFVLSSSETTSPRYPTTLFDKLSRSPNSTFQENDINRKNKDFLNAKDEDDILILQSPPVKLEIQKPRHDPTRSPPSLDATRRMLQGMSEDFQDKRAVLDHHDKNDLEDDMIHNWGHASWANSEDTYWYSEFSSLSFESVPTLPSSSSLLPRDQDQAGSSNALRVRVDKPPVMPRHDCNSEEVLPPPASLVHQVKPISRQSFIACPDEVKDHDAEQIKNQIEEPPTRSYSKINPASEN